MNPTLTLLLAQTQPADALTDTLKNARRTGNPELLVILACVAGLALVLLVWAVFFRRRPKTTRGSLVVEKRRKGSEATDKDSERKRRRRSEHGQRWGRNPTLAETGGLPPPRAEDTSRGDEPIVETQTASTHQVNAAPEPERPRIIRPS